MKKVLSILILLCVVALVGCGDDESEAENAVTANADGKAALNYPERDIRLIVPYAPGGGTDVIARAAAEYVDIDENIVVSNVEGGGAKIGTMEVVQAQPDGYTLLAHSITAIAGGYHVDLYDNRVWEDLEPIATITTQEGGIAVRSDSEFETVEDLIEYAKENPGELKISNAGFGGGTHILAATFTNLADIEVNHVPFDGTAPSRTALAGGHVDAISALIPEMADFIEDGQFRLLVTTGEERSDNYPDVPTMKEIGIDFVLAPKYGFFAPKGTPKEIIDELSAKFEGVTENEDYIELMETMSSSSDYLSTEEFIDELNYLDEMIGEVSHLFSDQ